MTGTTITRRRGTAAAGRRNDVAIDWSSPAEETSDGWLIAPKGSTEDNDGRASVSDELELHREGPAVDIAAEDRLVIRGRLYEVQGDPDVWIDDDDHSMDSMTVTARKVDG